MTHTPPDAEPQPLVDVALGIVLRNHPTSNCPNPRIEVLISRRREGAVYAGWWEIPGGKIDPGESPEEAVERELFEEVGARVEVTGRLPSVDHTYPHARVRLHPRLCALAPHSPEPRAIEVDEVRWIDLGELGAYRFPEANDAVVAALRVRLGVP